MPEETKKLSYSNLVKAEIIASQPKKDCCRRSLIDGMLYVKGEVGEGGVSLCLSNEDVISFFSKLCHTSYGVSPVCEKLAGDICRLTVKSDKLRNRVLYLTANAAALVSVGKCGACRAAFARGVFLACGRFTDPSKSFQLEFVCGSRTSDIAELLASLGMASRTTLRKGESIVYIKSSVTIEDFFTFIGANNAVFELINIKIENEIRNNANRVANCETNNINKAVSAAAVQIEAIRYLKENNLLSSLPQELCETAELRYENPELSISQLCIASREPISKSGMNHRLAKIVEIYRQALLKTKSSADDRIGGEDIDE